MGQILHGSATTTEAIRRSIQNSEESLRALSARYGINQKTVAKWRKRTSVADLPTGPKDAKSTVLTVDEEAMIVAFRRHTLLPLDDCLYALQSTIPHLTRSSLHRCLQRHDISRLPEVEGDKQTKKKFKAYPLGYFHVDIAEVQTPQPANCKVATSRGTSKFAFVELHQKAGKMVAAAFLRNLIAAVPYRLHIVLTEPPLVRHWFEPNGGGIQFTNHERHIYAFEHIFDRVCREHQIEHRLTKIKHPWTNGPPLGDCRQSPAGQRVERMNRTIKDATVKRFHYDDHDQLRKHMANFISAYNFGRRLKTLKGLAPYEFICKKWTTEPEKFTLNPIHQMPGLNT